MKYAKAILVIPAILVLIVCWAFGGLFGVLSDFFDWVGGKVMDYV